MQEMCFNAFARLVNAKEPVGSYEQKIIARVKGARMHTESARGRQEGSVWKRKCVFVSE